MFQIFVVSINPILFTLGGLAFRAADGDSRIILATAMYEHCVSCLSEKALIFLLSMIISPLVGLSRPPNRLSSVDLPLPDGPRITTRSP